MVEKVKKINYKRIFGFEELEEENKAKLICIKEGISQIRRVDSFHLERLGKVIENLEIEADLYPYKNTKQGTGVVYIDEAVKNSTRKILEPTNDEGLKAEDIYEREGFPKCCSKEHVYHEKLSEKIPEEDIVPEKFENFHLEAGEKRKENEKIPEEYFYVVRELDDPVPCEFGCEAWWETGRRTKEALEKHDEELAESIKRKNSREFGYHIEQYIKWKSKQN